VVEKKELYFGNVITIVIDKNFLAENVIFLTGSSLHIGTTEDLLKAVRQTRKS
jgi:hypothetical protein